MTVCVCLCVTLCACVCDSVCVRLCVTPMMSVGEAEVSPVVSVSVVQSLPLLSSKDKGAERRRRRRRRLYIRRYA